MIDRRSFFKSFAALIGAASLSPQIFIPKFEPVKWKVIKCGAPNGGLRVIPNPDYESTNYTLAIISHDGKLPCEFPHPIRGNEFDSKGNLISIPPFIYA